MGVNNKRETYASLIDYVALRGASSFSRTKKVLSSLCKSMQQAVEQGNNLDLDGLMLIEYVSSSASIYENKVHGLEEQVQDVVKDLGYSKDEIHKLVMLYFKRIRELVETGYQGNIKGIAYIIPKEDAEGIYCDTRTSPVLKKPEQADYLVIGSNGELEVRTLTAKELRFSITLSDRVKIPSRIAERKKLNLEVVDI